VTEFQAADHISWQEWLALIGLLLGPPALLALGLYLIYRAVHG
jgi:hypothetical protein